VAELIGQIHQTEGAAVKMAEYWQEHYCGGAPVTAEVVTFQVPTVGVGVKSEKDLLNGSERTPDLL
jgi:hypothetical protein